MRCHALRWCSPHTRAKTNVYRAARDAPVPISRRLRAGVDALVTRALGRPWVSGPALVVVVGTALALWPGDATHDDDDETSAQSAAATDVDTEVAKPRDPWSVQPVPEPLAGIRESLEAGKIPDREADAALRDYAGAHRDDPRPQLLLGHLFHRRGWRTDALARYRAALQIDTAARGDPRVLTNLIDLVRGESLERSARTVLVAHYGDEALAAIDAALASDDLTPPEARRLRRVREAITDR